MQGRAEGPAAVAYVFTVHESGLFEQKTNRASSSTKEYIRWNVSAIATAVFRDQRD